MNARGQDLTEVAKNVAKGELYEAQMKAFIKGLCGITLEKSDDKYCPYDFTVKGCKSVFVEYKALHLRQLINRPHPCIYKNIIIPVSKIQHYQEIRDDAEKKKKIVPTFIYMISLFYVIENIQHKIHRYLLLDLDKITQDADTITGVLNNSIDTVPHYKLRYLDFMPIETFKTTIENINSTG